jgi:hydroxymethylglutaryl-CoA lyase
MITSYSDPLIVQEVAPRDGLQIEPTWVATEDKIALIDGLSSAGFSRIEAGSFVSPKAIPALRDGEQVFQGIRRNPGTVYVALVPNLIGAQRALHAGADELNMVMSASQTHNRANMRMSCEASLAGFADIVAGTACTTVTLNATVATAFGCPFEGEIDADRVLASVSGWSMCWQLMKPARAASTLRSAVWAVVRLRPAPPVISVPKTWSICARKSASPPASICRA